jgi:polyisoprenoid-binding protein YceI
VDGGTAAFIAPTNVSAISIKGKSAALHAQVAMHKTADGLVLEHIEATLPVKSLLTGMSLRDEHMRKHIFTTADGQIPDLKFEGDNSACAAQTKETLCQVTGNLSIRGVAHAFTLALKIKEEGAQYRASGDTVVKLSDYGIEQPTQFGVKSSNEVQLHLDFVAKPAPAHVALAGAR